MFNEKGLKMVNLSKAHTSDEFIAVGDLVATSEFVRCYQMC